MTIPEAVGTAVGISTIVTFIITRLWDAYSMQKKYRTKSAAEKCMTERQKAEANITAILSRVEKRLQLGNLAISDLWDHAKIPRDKLLQYEKDLDIKLRDNGK